MNFGLTARSLAYALIIAVAAWVLHGFIEALLAACVIAVASWPLYCAFAARVPRGVGRGTTSLVFTLLLTTFVLAPLMFTAAALLTEAQQTMLAIAAVDRKEMVLPSWLYELPVAGPSLAARLAKLAQPAALEQWAERAEPGLFITWAHSLTQFTIRHVFIVLFTVLLLSFLYEYGELLSAALRRALRLALGGRAERYLEVARDAVRASVTSMLLVGLFDGVLSWAAYAVAGVPQAAVWGAITGAFGLVPFLGYVAVLALALKLALQGAAAPAISALLLGSLVLVCGDKLVRPVMARNGTHLPYVWGLMGCLGGFEVLGLVGLVIGPVALTLAREMLTEASLHRPVK
jgi:predicted PurR-regulated permease PerM